MFFESHAHLYFDHYDEDRDKLINEQNLILEQLINERNKELINKNETLIVKQKQIEKDNQLHQALMLLKGVHVFSTLRN